MTGVDAKNYRNELGLKNKAYRAIWNLVWTIAFRLSPIPFFFWRTWLLRLFGAKISDGAKVYPSCRIWAPYNLTMDKYSCLGPKVECYSVDKIIIGANATVSQRSFLCTASHDITNPLMPLTTKPISIGHSAWVAAEAFIGPGVKIGEGAVVAARAVAVKPVAPWTVVAGNPARVVSQRKLAS